MRVLHPRSDLLGDRDAAEVEAGWPSLATDDVAEQPSLDAVEIRERMSGNICRCGAYPNIVSAIEEVFA